jgi:hypothetical protein
LETLGERGEIKKVKQGRTERLWPI